MEQTRRQIFGLGVKATATALLTSLAAKISFADSPKTEIARRQTPVARETPYFEGQNPHPCGHYYPDVMRVKDEKLEDGTVVRVTHCIACGIKLSRALVYQAKPGIDEADLHASHFYSREGCLRRFLTAE
jgi:hypothetical protein